MKKQLLSVLLCLCMTVTLLPAISTRAAAAVIVPYIDAVGNPQSVSATPITSGMTTWSAGWYYVSGSISLSDVTVSGAVNLILTDNADMTVTGSNDTAAIYVYGPPNSLTIYGQEGGTGLLSATNTAFGAGLGGSNDIYGGAITINGGMVTTHTYFGAGIGGGKFGDGGTITINGGIVTANTDFGTGIGGGFGGKGGTITINGGIVTASTDFGTGIGGGFGGSGGTITINGGIVTANGNSGAAIGGGCGGNSGTITINGGTVTANGNSGAGIGGGDSGACTTTIINGGMITANSSFGAGIGGGQNDDSGLIIINDCIIKASSSLGAGIGGGNGGNGLNFIISNGTVTASSIFGAGIGGGNGGNGGSVKITGGSVKASGDFAQAIGHGLDGLVSGTIQNDSETNVFLTTVTLADLYVNAAITSLTTSLTGYTYGASNMNTDGNGSLYLWLPADTNVTAAGTARFLYGGSVSSGSTGFLYTCVGLRDILLSNSYVLENSPVDTAVGELSTSTIGYTSTDFTYLLVPGEGAADNASFSISGTSLKLAISPDYETKSSYSIRIRSTNGDGMYFEKPFVVTITDVNEAPIVTPSGSSTTASVGEVVAVDDALTVSDPFSATLSSAAVSITANFQSGKDSLSFTNTGSEFGNITGSYDESSGVLTLTSSGASATVAQWQAALRAVHYHYENGEATPNTHERTIQFVVNNGLLNSTPATITIAFAPLVSACTPADGATAVMASGNVQITFSEAMDPSAGIVSLTPSEGSTILLTGGTWSSGNTTYTVSYSALNYNTAYALAVSGFKDAAGNVMAAYSRSFTTELEPLTPSASPETLTIVKGGTAGFSVALGQGAAAATSAAITVADGTIASVDSSLFTENGAVTVSGLTVGTTTATVAFNDASGTHKTVSVSVTAAVPVWPAASSLTVSGTSSYSTLLTWPAASDITAVTAYHIYKNGTLIGTVDGSTLTYTVTGLSASTGYSFQIQAGNADGAWTSDGPTASVTTTGVSSSESGSISGSSSITATVAGSNGITDIVDVTTSGSRAVASISTDQSTVFARGGALELNMPTVNDATTYGVALPANDLSENTSGTLTMDTCLGSIVIPSNMLSSLSSASDNTAEISIGQGNKDALPEDVKTAIGDRPLIQLTLAIDGSQTEWRNPDAPVTVSIPYTPTAEELKNPESIIIWYIDGSGNIVTIPNGHYDPATGSVTFSTTHFSQYAVSYNMVVFCDVTENEWFYNAVSFIAARGITGGTSDSTFSPNAMLTRGQFITLLMRAYGIAPDTNATENFSDAGNTYYTGYLAAAKRLGISNGVGDNKYAPEQEITRQEMFTLLYNAMKVMNELPEEESEKTLSDFVDGSSISYFAQEALECFVKAGVVNGNNGYLLPTTTTTRAQMAQVLYNLLEK